MSARLIVYFPLADPAAPTDILDLYAEAGVDIVELGRPSPSPYHDGIDVTASMARPASLARAPLWIQPTALESLNCGPKGSGCRSSSALGFRTESWRVRLSVS